MNHGQVIQENKEEIAMARFQEITGNVSKYYMFGSSWIQYASKATFAQTTAVRFKTEANNPFYLSYRTYNKGKGWLPYVTSTNVNDYAGYPSTDPRCVQSVGIKVIDSVTGTSLDSKYIAMYRAYVNDKWQPWVSNAKPELMYAVFNEFCLDGSLDTSSGDAGAPGSEYLLTRFELRIFKDNGVAEDDEGFAGGVVNSEKSILVGNDWCTFTDGITADHIDGLKLQTGVGKNYYLLYKTWNEGRTSYYPAVKSNENDYAGSPNKPIQKVNIQVCRTDGTTMGSGVIVMYRALVDGEWQPWVSNADPEWMSSTKAKLGLDGTLNTSGTFAGAEGKNIKGIEIHIYEDDSANAGTGNFVGVEKSLSLRYMVNSATNWVSFDKKTVAGQMDGIEIKTSGTGYYLLYKTWNSGKTSYYPAVKSTDNDYAGVAGRAIQRLNIKVYKNDGTQLTKDVVVMYRARVDGAWQPWVSNADPEWMESVKEQFNLDGTLDTKSGYAGADGKNIQGIEVRLFEGSTVALPEEELPGVETIATTSYLKNGSWTSFDKQIEMTGIDGIKIQTLASKPYYLAYKTQNEGQSSFYPIVTSRQNDYAGVSGKPIQKLCIQVYKNDGTKLATGVVVMYRVYVDGAWLPWVSNANPDWMQAVQVKYALGGRMDTESAYAGINGKNIEGVEIRIFEENTSTTVPVGNYKIIPNVPFISQVGTYPTGCESVSTVMALQHAGVNMSVDTFIDTYLDKQAYPFNPNETFGGNPRSTSGFGCYAPVIKKALDKFLPELGYRSRLLYHPSLEKLCSDYIDNDVPVILWATMEMKSPYVSRTWVHNGTQINWIAPEHCLLLVGYDDNHYIFHDPLKNTGHTFYSKEAVEVAYEGLYEQAIVLVPNVPVSEVVISSSNVKLIEGELLKLTATVLPKEADDSVTWSSSDTSVATVNGLGMVTAKKIGTANIMASIGNKSDICEVTVVGSKDFGELGAQGYIIDSDVRRTSDNFCITQTSLADILSGALIDELESEESVYSVYDDWHLFSVQQGTQVAYGLCKMREQEFDGVDGDAPGVTISFIGFDIAKLMNCIDNPTTNTKQILVDHITDVVKNVKVNDVRIPYNSTLGNYFKEAQSKAPYLIADMYTQFIADKAINGVIEAPVNCKNVLQHYWELTQEVNSSEFSLQTQEYQVMILKELNEISRVPLALENNNEQAGRQIFKDNKIYISNTNNLTIYEKYAILMSHSGNVNFNSFAAEVVFHAQELESLWSTFNEYYKHAMRADMSLGEEYESGFLDSYYNLEGALVQDQIRYHGEL